MKGKKGGSYLSTGYVYAPYIPMQTTPTILGVPVSDFVLKFMGIPEHLYPHEQKSEHRRALLIRILLELDVDVEYDERDISWSKFTTDPFSPRRSVLTRYSKKIKPQYYGQVSVVDLT